MRFSHKLVHNLALFFPSLKLVQILSSTCSDIGHFSIIEGTWFIRTSFLNSWLREFLAGTPICKCVTHSGVETFVISRN